MPNVTLLTGRDSPALSRTLLDRFRAHRPGAALWIAPTDRIRRQVVTTWARVAGIAFHNQVFTFPELARLLAGPLPPERILPDAHQRLLMTELVEALRREGQLPTFGHLADKPGFLAALFRLASELRGQGVSPAEFARALEALPERRELGVVYQRFCGLLRTNRWIDRAEFYARAIERVAAGLPPGLAAVESVYLDGFSDFTEPQWSLLQKFGPHVKELCFGFLDDGRREELFAVPRKSAHRVAATWPDAKREAVADSPENPAGLAYLKARLFDPDAPPQKDSQGIRFIEAPAELGEARLVARAVKSALLSQVSPDDIIVAVRRLEATADLWVDVFAEYEIPCEIEAARPIANDPALIALLDAAALPECEFAFAPTAALLRSTWLRPEWEEFKSEPRIGCHAESLLRQLREPRGREHYLAATRRWAERVEPPPAEEAADMPARQRTHELAKRCEPFLIRIFAVWDALPDKAPLAEHREWLQRFAKELGFPLDGKAIKSLDHELEQWQRRQQQLGRAENYSHSEFLALTRTLASGAALTGDAGPGRVRILPAELAAGIDCDHLFLTGLGERNFPSPQPFDPLLDVAERKALRATIPVAVNDDHLSHEMLLYFRLVSSPARSLTLSRAAVDAKGQELLPGTYWRTTRALFEGVKPERQEMLVEGLNADPPLSPAEFRVRAGRGITDEVTAHLIAAKVMATRRSEPSFGIFDGLLAAPSSKAEVRRRFGSHRIFSPSTIERYIDCPFRFFLRDVLRLDELADPDDDVAMSDRGRACHRALSRVHGDAELLSRLSDALGEAFAAEVEIEAAHSSSPAVKMLWSLEVERFRRTAQTFARHTQKLLEDWREKQVTLRPHAFEHEFQVTLEGVNLQGRIDRVDIASLSDGSEGLVVFDYKSGSGVAYTPARQRDMSLVQLPIYAAAAQEAFGVRPLGMAYWLLDDGPKAYPAKFAWLDQDGWPEFKKQLIDQLRAVVERIGAGQFPLAPREDTTCDRCGYRRTCRISGSREKDWDLTPNAGGGTADD